MEQLAAKLAKRFLRNHLMDQQEAESAAGWYYLQALRTHNEKRASLQTWITQTVNFGLRNEWRKEAKRKGRITEIPLQEIPSREWNFRTFLLELSNDAQEIILLCVDYEETLSDFLLPKTQGRSEEKRIRWALREYLTEHGWSEQRINEGFTEIQEALLQWK